MKNVLLKRSALVSLVFILAAAGMAEEVQVSKKKLFVHLRGGASFADSSWSFDHYLIHKRTEASSAKGPFYEVGIERKKNRAGWRISIGTMPSKVTVLPDDVMLFETRIVTFSTNYFNVNRVYYFGAENSRFSPFINGGLGIIMCSGGITNIGALFNLGAGLAINPLGNLFFNAGLEGRIPFYLNFRESESMNRSTYFFFPVLFVGASYRI